jgi:predicted permease
MIRRLRAWVMRVAALVGFGRSDREIDDELDAHRELLAADYRRSGLTDEEARRAAAVAFGPIASAAGAYRDQRGIRRLEDLWRDVREAARSLTRSRARVQRSTAVVALLTVCLTMGVAVFAVVDGLLLKPLPFRDPDQLFVVGPPNRLDSTRPGSVDFGDLDELRRAAGVDGAFSYDFDADRAKDRFRPARERHISTEFFDVLGVAPALGRALGAGDGGQQPRAVVIGYGLWQAAFAGDPQVVGRVVSIGDDRVLVQGVMPRGFDFPHATTMWSLAPVVPPRPDRPRARFRYMAAVVRLARGASPAPLRLSGTRVAAVPLAEYLRPGDAWSIVPVSCAVLLLVVLGLTHLAVAQATHAVLRARETAIRAALGSGWLRIARHWLIESVLLTLAAAILAALAAPAALALIIRLLPTELTFGQAIAIDGRAVTIGAMAAGVAMATLTAVSIAVLRRSHLPDILRGRLTTTRRGGAGRARYVLLGAQVAVVTGLVYVGALALRSFVLADHADLGATAEGLVAIDWNDPRPGDVRTASRRDIAERARRMPDVISVAFGPSPFEPNRAMLQFSVTPILTAAEARAASAIEVRGVSPNYFTTAGIALVEGRGFETERDERDVVMFSQSLARRAFPGGSAIGRHVYLGSDRPAEVVGVVADVRVMGPDAPPRELVYMPYSGSGLLVRLRPDAHERIADITAIVRGAVPDASTMTITDVATQRDHLLDAQRARAALLGLLGVVSFGLGMAGVFAMAGETVQRRLRDAAIRMALGAPSAQVVRQLVSSVLLVVAGGLLAGLVAGGLGARAAGSLFYGVQPNDLSTIATVVVTMLASAALAAIAPARRAATSDVLKLLKDE